MLHTETASPVDQFGRFTIESDYDQLVAGGHDDRHVATLDYLRRLKGLLGEFGLADAATAVLEHLHEHPDAFVDAGLEAEAVCCHRWWTPEHVGVGTGSQRLMQ